MDFGENLRVAKLTENSFLPTKSSPGSAAFDLYSTKNYIICPKEKLQVPTDLQIAIPKGYAGRIVSRSGLAFKHDLYAFHGTIDSDYRANLVVLMFNHGDSTYMIKRGERIAQLLLSKVSEVQNVVECKFLGDIDIKTHQGFGSSGK